MINPRLALTGLLCAGVAACSFDAEDLDTWSQSATGGGKLAAYFADEARPQALRLQAAEHLYARGDLPALFTVVRQAQGPAQAARLAELARMATTALAQERPAVQARGAELAFQVLAFHPQLSAEGRAELAGASLRWAVAGLGRAQAGERRRTPEDLFLASALADPQPAQQAALALLREAPADEIVLATLQVLKALRDPAVELAAAEALLARAHRLHPQVSPALLDALLANGDETLLKYVLALAGELSLPLALRKLAFDAADRRLKGKGLEVHQSLLRLDDPANDNEIRLVALDRILEYGQAAALRPALLALNPEGSWPTEGEGLKTLIGEYCDGHIARFKAEARPVLLEVIEAPHWLARAFAMECVIRLFPDEAPELLIDLIEDATPLPGWRIEGPTTFGEVVRALQPG